MSFDNPMAYEQRYRSNQSISSASFSSQSSGSSTDDYLHTPSSTPPHHQESYSYKNEDQPTFPLPTPIGTPVDYDAPRGFYNTISCGSDEMISEFGSLPIMYEAGPGVYPDLNMMAYSNFTGMGPQLSNSSMLGNNVLAPSMPGMVSYDHSSTMVPAYSGPFVIPAQTMTVDSPIHLESMVPGLTYGMGMPAPVCERSLSTSSTPSIRSVHSVCSDASPMTETRHLDRRQNRMRSLPSSMALHRVQSGRPFPSDPNHASPSVRRRQKQESALPRNTSRVPSASKKCPFPNCPKRFQRQEHLKRHEKTHGAFEGFPCEFCIAKPFSRTDNLKSHVKLHTDPNRGPSSRTKYHPAALARYEAMSRKPRKHSTGVKDEESS